MARNDQDDRSRRKSYSPNARDFDREYNAHGAPRQAEFRNEYSGNADRWTGYDEGPQHWREGREGRDDRSDERYEESGRHNNPGQSDRGIYQADQGHEAARGPDVWRDRGRGNWGGSSYGSGVSNYSAVGPYNSVDSGGGGYSGPGSYGAGYLGGMGSYANRARGQHAGRGPKGYRRSDERIREEINDRLTDHPDIDATEIEVTVETGIVTLTGSVEDRHAKRLAEDVADSVAGVGDVNNQIRVQKHGDHKPKEETDTQPVTTLGINPGDRKLKQTETK